MILPRYVKERKATGIPVAFLTAFLIAPKQIDFLANLWYNIRILFSDYKIPNSDCTVASTSKRVWLCVETMAQVLLCLNVLIRCFFVFWRNPLEAGMDSTIR